MMRKRMLRVLSVMLICIFALSACKKNVGTPEDNAVTEETQDSEETEEDLDRSDDCAEATAEELTDQQAEDMGL